MVLDQFSGSRAWTPPPPAKIPGSAHVVRPSQ